MMDVAVRISVKDFNVEKLQEELAQASLPIHGITWAGFIRSGERLYTPFPEASLLVMVMTLHFAGSYGSLAPPR
jgi:hypothetical protein